MPKEADGEVLLEVYAADVGWRWIEVMWWETKGSSSQEVIRFVFEISLTSLRVCAKFF